MSNLLEIQDIHKSYDKGSSRVDVLNGINMTIQQGTTTALVGTSGAGKSTLLHLLGALDRPSSGKILFHGKDLFSKSDHELATFRNKSIGFIFQFHHLLPEFSALENVMMPALIARTPRNRATAIAEELLNDVGLGQRMTHRPGELSGGEQQRVAIARALALSPELLLADEPTGNLDMKTSAGVHTLLCELRAKKGLTLVVVTHNEHLAAAMDKTVHLVDGRIE